MNNGANAEGVLDVSCISRSTNVSGSRRSPASFFRPGRFCPLSIGYSKPSSNFNQSFSDEVALFYNVHVVGHVHPDTRPPLEGCP